MREAGVELLPLRKKNSLRPVPPYLTDMQHFIRKIVETTSSLIERLRQRLGAQGRSFVLACSINSLVATCVNYFFLHCNFLIHFRKLGTERNLTIQLQDSYE